MGLRLIQEITHKSTKMAEHLIKINVHKEVIHSVSVLNSIENAVEIHSLPELMDLLKCYCITDI